MSPRQPRRRSDSRAFISSLFITEPVPDSPRPPRLPSGTASFHHPCLSSDSLQETTTLMSLAAPGAWLRVRERRVASSRSGAADSRIHVAPAQPLHPGSSSSFLSVDSAQTSSPTELIAHGPIFPTSLRHKITPADGLSHHLVTDPLSSTLLDFSRTTCAPPPFARPTSAPTTSTPRDGPGQADRSERRSAGASGRRRPPSLVTVRCGPAASSARQRPDRVHHLGAGPARHHSPTARRCGRLFPAAGPRSAPLGDLPVRCRCAHGQPRAERHPSGVDRRASKAGPAS